MTLVDTSAWVEFLRDTGGSVCTRVDELLLRRLLARAAMIQTVPADYEDAAALYRISRRGGETVRKLIDCLIGAIAIRADLPVLHGDSDFDVLARHTTLRSDQP